MKKLIIPIVLLLIMLIILIPRMTKNTIEDISKDTKIVFPLSAELVRYKKSYRYFIITNKIFLHVKINESEMQNFTMQFIENEELIQSGGFYQNERFFLEWCGLREENPNFQYIFKKKHLSLNLKSIEIVEIILILNSENGYPDVYIYKKNVD